MIADFFHTCVIGFEGGPQFVFNVGGQRGFRVHQFGRGAPRRRPHNANGNRQGQRDAGGWDTLVGLLPILFLFLFPLITSIFSGSASGDGYGGAPAPRMSFDTAEPPLTLHRTTPKFGVDYFVNPAEVGFARALRRACSAEVRTKQTLLDDAQGWFFPDQDKLRVAKEYQMINCQRLDRLGISR